MLLDLINMLFMFVSVDQSKSVKLKIEFRYIFLIDTYLPDRSLGMHCKDWEFQWQ